MVKKTSKKKIITRTVYEASIWEFEGTATDLRTRIDEWIEIYGPNFRIDWNPYRHYDYDRDPSPCFNILVDREETPEEEAKRLEQEAAQQSARLEHERAEFERLLINSNLNSMMNDDYYDYMKPQFLLCGNIAYFDYGSGCSHRCEHCMATVGSIGMPRECKKLYDIEAVVAILKGNQNGSK